MAKKIDENYCPPGSSFSFVQIRLDGGRIIEGVNESGHFEACYYDALDASECQEILNDLRYSTVESNHYQTGGGIVRVSRA